RHRPNRPGREYSVHVARGGRQLFLSPSHRGRHDRQDRADGHVARVRCNCRNRVRGGRHAGTATLKFPATSFQPLTHSCRTAAIGSMDAARYAGARQATAATARSSTVTPDRITGSRELSVTQREATLSKIRHRRTPAISPAPTVHDVPDTTMPTTSCD